MRAGRSRSSWLAFRSCHGVRRRAIRWSSAGCAGALSDQGGRNHGPQRPRREQDRGAQLGPRVRDGPHARARSRVQRGRPFRAGVSHMGLGHPLHRHRALRWRSRRRWPNSDRALARKASRPAVGVGEIVAAGVGAAGPKTQQRRASSSGKVRAAAISYCAAAKGRWRCGP